MKILVVDDSVMKRRLAGRLLEKAGHTVVEAEHTNDGLRRLKENPDIELVVVDFEMPDEDGGNGRLFARKALCTKPWLKLILHSSIVGTDNVDVKASKYLFRRHTNTAAELPRLIEELAPELVTAL